MATRDSSPISVTNLIPFLRLLARAVIVASAGMAAGLASSTAQSPDDDGPPQVAAAGAVRVPLEVYVRDAHGNPVRGLTRNDFELFVTDVATSDFDVSIHGRDRPVPGDHASEELALQVLVYVDEATLMPPARNQALSEIADFLDETLGPSDEVMLVSRAQDLLLREPLTSNIARVSRALRLMELDPALAVARRRANEFEHITRRIEDATTAEIAFELAAEHARSLYRDSVRGLRALETSILDLAGTASRKALLYVGDAGSLIAGEDLFRQVHRKFPDHPTPLHAMEYDIRRPVQEVIRSANSQGVTIYGLQPRATRRAESDERGALDETSQDSVAELLAQQTGGLTVQTGRQRGGLGRIADDFREYVTIHVPGPQFSDRRYHRFGVNLNREPDLWTVRYRSGHRERGGQARMHDTVLAALRLDQQSNPLDVQLMMGRQTWDDNGALLVPLIVSIPHERITFESVDGELSSQVRLWIVSRSALGTSAVLEMPLQFRLDHGDVDREGAFDLTHRVSLRLKPGYTDVAVAIRDELAGTASTIRRGYWLHAPEPDDPDDDESGLERLPLFGRHAAGIEAIPTPEPGPGSRPAQSRHVPGSNHPGW